MADLMAYIYFAFIVIMFLVLITFTKRSLVENMNSQTMSNDDETLLLMFLQNRINFEGHEMSVARFINFYEAQTSQHNQGPERDLLYDKPKSASNDFFSKANRIKSEWRINFEFSQDKIYFPENAKAFERVRHDKDVGRITTKNYRNKIEIRIPSINNNTISVTLYPPKNTKFINFEVQNE